MSSKLTLIAAVHQRARLAAEDELLRRARARAVRHPLLDEVRRLGPGTARAREVHGVARDRLGDRHATHELLERDDVRAGDRVLKAMRSAPTSSTSRPAPPDLPAR